MSESELVQVLQVSRLARELSDEELRVLAKSLALRDLRADEVLVPEGTTDDKLYVVVKGTLAVVKNAETDHPVVLLSLYEKDLVGELSFIDGTPHYASIVAVTPTRVLALQRQQLEALLATHPRIVYGVMRAIVRTVHEIQRRVAMHANELVKYIYKQEGRY